jgi:hypothetical protein
MGRPLGDVTKINVPGRTLYKSVDETGTTRYIDDDPTVFSSLLDAHQPGFAENLGAGVRGMVCGLVGMHHSAQSSRRWPNDARTGWC